MSDDSSKRVPGDGPPTWRQWMKWIKKAISWTTTALLIWVLVRAAWLFRPGDARHDIVAGPDTTVVTGPLSADGFIDFTAALNDQASAGVTQENNAVVLLMQAYGTGIIEADRRGQYFQLLGVPAPPEDGSYLLDDRGFLAKQGIGDGDLAEHLFPLEDAEKEADQRPWTRDEFPRVAELVETNRAPLELVSAAAQRTRFYAPMTGRVFNNPLPVEKRMRVAVRLLRQRAMLQLGEGNASAASEDLLTCHRLARLTGQSPRSNLGMIIACELASVAMSGHEHLIASKLLTADEARRFLAEWEALPPLPEWAEVVDGPGRLEAVEAIYAMAAGSPDIANSADAADGKFAARTARAVDWNVILRMLNADFDRAVAAMRMPTDAERAAAYQQIKQERDRRKFRVHAVAWAFVGLSEPMSREIGGMFSDLLSPGVGSGNSPVRDAYTKLTRIGFALAIFEREQGAYPAKLDELAPAILTEVPLDPCSGEAFRYERTDDGFLLYSIGLNRRNDGGATYEDVPPGTKDPPDDIRMRVGKAPVAAPVAE